MFKYQIDYRYYYKYRIISYKNPYIYTDTSKMKPHEMWLFNITKSLWESDESTTDRIIRESHERSTANYKHKVKELIK